MKDSLKNQVIRSAAWNVLGSGLGRMVAIASAIILARLLSPEDYAFAGLGIVLLGIFNMLAAHGFGYYIIQQKTLNDETCHSIFWLVTFVGFVLTFFVFVSAPWLARFYQNPDLILIVRILGIGIVVNLIGGVPNALLQRRMEYFKINILSIIGTILTSIAGVLIAWFGYGYWALIIPGVAMGLCTASLVFWVSGYCPAFVFKWDEIRKSGIFGLTISIANILTYIGNNLDYLIMGRYWKPPDFGQYYFAFEKSRVPYQIITSQVSNVFMPAFSRVQDNLSELRNIFLKGTYNCCLIVYPFYVILIGLADPLFPWIFGEQWYPSVPVFQVFCAYILIAAPSSITAQVLLALNRPQFFLFFNCLRIVSTLPILLYLGMKGANILTTATVLMSVWVLLLFVWFGYAYSLMKLSWKESWNNLKDLIGITLSMGFVLFASKMLLRAYKCPNLLTVMIVLSISLGTYWYLARHPISELAKQTYFAVKSKKK
jgi:O-antigen/teichoic acid export membrane protein